MEIYDANSKVWKLYKRIEDGTLKQFQTEKYVPTESDPKLDDIIIEKDGVKLVGKNGCSALFYEYYPGKDRALANFETEENPEPFKTNHLLDLLEEHFGEATSRESTKLYYKIKIGEKTTTRDYQQNTYKPTTQKETEDIMKLLVLQLHSWTIALPEKN